MLFVTSLQVTVDRPDVQGRVRILKVHSRGKQIGKDVDFEKIARRTPGKISDPLDFFQGGLLWQRQCTSCSVTDTCTCWLFCVLFVCHRIRFVCCKPNAEICSHVCNLAAM